MAKKTAICRKAKPKVTIADVYDLLMTLNAVMAVVARQVGSVSTEQARRSAPIRTSVDEDTEYQNERTEAMFNSLSAVKMPHSTRAFLGDLKAGFEQYGSLTRAQYECLRRNYDKFINDVPFSVRA